MNEDEVNEDDLDEDDLDLVQFLSEEFWIKYSDIVNEVLEKTPDNIRDLVEIRLQELSNIYSRKT